MTQQTILGVLATILLVVTLVFLGRIGGGVSAQGNPTPSPDLEEALELARNFSGSNADWTPVIQEFDGIAMVLVPAGCFMMGSTDEQIEASFQLCETRFGEECKRSWFEDEAPLHTVCFEEPFWIDRYEVTNAQFETFKGVAENSSFETDRDRPRERINWSEASNFCESRGGRLPTEAEWEYAARGSDGWLYPWGNDFAAEQVVRDAQTAHVGSKPGGASWVGALDLSGNVWEWVADWYGPYSVEPQKNPTGPLLGDLRVLRGGALSSLEYGMRSTMRAADDPNYGGNSAAGFRCARSMDATSALSAATAEPTPEPTLVDPETVSLPAGAHNADWTPVIQEFDGVEMVLVPAGSFEMGSTEDEIDYALELCQQAAASGAACERSWYTDEAPTSMQNFATPFWIDKYEVSRAQYQQCVDAGKCDAVPASDYSTEPNQPINLMNWFLAQAYCEWRGARLPTEAEWEYAARGPDRLWFPWGNEFADTLANHCDRNCGESDSGSGYSYVNEENDDGYAITAPADSYPGGASWVGALNMSGNVWEWTYSLYQDYPYDIGDGREQDTGDRTNVARVLRGGSFDVTTVYLRAANRDWLIPVPGPSRRSVGFRCARSMDTTSALPAVTAEPTPEPTPVEPETAALSAGAHNTDWTPVIQEFDGVEMVLVPAGCFMMGSTEDEIAALIEQEDSEWAAWYWSESPQHRVCFEASFWMGRTEVTNAQYRRCVEAGGCTPPDPRYYDDPQYADHPVVSIFWREANAYAAWLGETTGADVRLLTEAQWEYAARGPDGVTYPWGNDAPTCELANISVNGERCASATSPVTRYPAGMSWVGALNMSGNVWEWIADWYGEYPADQQVNPDGPAYGTRRMLRGGGWFSSESSARTATRNADDPLYWNAVGFRIMVVGSLNVDASLPAIPPAPMPTPTPVSPEQVFLPDGSQNTDWTPVIQEFDGVEMVLVPAGCFQMGSTDEQIEAAFQQCEAEYGTGNCDRGWYEAERPAHEVCLDAYWIDRTEVSNGQFEAFNGQAANPSRWTEAERPREKITWREARDFCESRGARLPTEAEWEYAARGPEGWMYPWGNEWDGARLNYCDVNCDYNWRDSNVNDGYAETAPVGSYPGGASWVGALDLSGNVREFVSSLYQSYPYDAADGRESNTDISKARVMRGGSWYDANYDYFRASYRNWNLPYNWFHFDGFRCVRSW